MNAIFMTKNNNTTRFSQIEKLRFKKISQLVTNVMKILRSAKSRMTGIITQGLPVYGTNAGIVEKDGLSYKTI